ncbi:MAG: hypothetical protein NkDv07_0887 [Candidatus Improbicoccus devescovinae]|nr:MAG: hypothetical protein NkDv07_0887 [Candidatus Improbicoccus devescovinae]
MNFAQKFIVILIFSLFIGSSSIIYGNSLDEPRTGFAILYTRQQQVVSRHLVNFFHRLGIVIVSATPEYQENSPGQSPHGRPTTITTASGDEIDLHMYANGSPLHLVTFFFEPVGDPIVQLITIGYTYIESVYLIRNYIARTFGATDGIVTTHEVYQLGSIEGLT